MCLDIVFSHLLEKMESIYTEPGSNIPTKPSCGCGGDEEYYEYYNGGDNDPKNPQDDPQKNTNDNLSRRMVPSKEERIVYIVIYIIGLIIIIIVAILYLFGVLDYDNAQENFKLGTVRSDSTGAMTDLMTNSSKKWVSPLPAPDIPVIDSKLGLEHLNTTKRHVMKYKEDKLENYKDNNVQYDNTPDDDSSSDSEDSMAEAENKNREVLAPSPKYLSGADEYPGPNDIPIQPPFQKWEYPWAHMNCMNPWGQAVFPNSN